MSATAALLTLLVLAAPAQIPDEKPRINSFDELLPHNARDLARARFAASQAEPRRLQEEQRRTARAMFRSRYSEFLAGRGTLEFLIEIARNLLDANLALASNDADRLHARERFWVQMAEIDVVNKERFFSGRVTLRDFHRGHFYRLNDEIAMLDARAANTNLRPWARGVPSDPAVISRRELARAKFAASHADALVLRRETVQSGQVGHYSGSCEWYAGRGTLDFTLIWSLRLLLADCGSAQSGAELLTGLDRHCRSLCLMEDVNTGRYEAGRVAIQDLASSREWLLEAQLWRADARTQFGMSAARTPTPWLVAPELTEGIDRHLVTLGPEDRRGEIIKRLARFEAAYAEADTSRMMRERLAALREIYAAREHEFVNNRATLDFLLNSALRLERHEYATATDDAERQAARERYWKRLQQIEAVTRRRFEEDRYRQHDYDQVRFHRLGAELGLLPGGPRP